MSGRDPAEIWEENVEEGERRLSRGRAGLAATGLIGGFDVMLGVALLVVAQGALTEVMPEDTAHVLASATFGIGLVLIIVGRSELFTESFVVPIAAMLRDRGGLFSFGRLWSLMLVGNLVGLFVLALVLTRAGLVPSSALDAASSIAETYAQRDALTALLSAFISGIVMTHLMWLALAVDEDIARIAIALLLGFLMAAPSLNHAVVSTGQMALGIMAGRGEAGWEDLAQNFPLAVAGNMAGSLGLLMISRLVQARAEPE